MNPRYIGSSRLWIHKIENPLTWGSSLGLPLDYRRCIAYPVCEEISPKFFLNFHVVGHHWSYFYIPWRLFRAVVASIRLQVLWFSLKTILASAANQQTIVGTISFNTILHKLFSSSNFHSPFYVQRIFCDSTCYINQEVLVDQSHFLQYFGPYKFWWTFWRGPLSPLDFDSAFWNDKVL